MHNWWPDTWEKLPASAPPPSPRRRRTLRRRGLPTSGGCAQLHLRKNQLLSAQLRNLHSFLHCLDQTGHLSLQRRAQQPPKTANSAVFCTVWIMHVSSTTTGMSTTPKNCTCRIKPAAQFALCVPVSAALRNVQHSDDE